jgi:hypothetical protein
MSTRARSAPAALLLLLGLAAPSAEAYRLRTSASGKVLVWTTREPTVEIDTTAIPKVKGAAQALRAAFSTWRKAGVPIAVRSTQEQGAPVADDGRNVLSFISAGWSYGEEVVAMTLSTYRESDGRIRETDIVFNAELLTWSAAAVPPATAYDIQNAATHEAGHFLGLDHEPSLADAAMYPLTVPGEIQKRELSADDRAGASALAAAILAEQKADDPEEIGAPLGEGGCGGGGDLAFALALCVPLLPRRRPRRVVGRAAMKCLLCAVQRTTASRVLLVALLTLAAGQARATIVRPLSLAELARTAPVIGEGRVVGLHSYREGGWIFTDYRIAVSRCHRGACDGGTLTVRTPGGRVGGLVMEVAGMPRLSLGSELLLFGRRYGAAVIPVGLAAGVVRIEGGVGIRDLRGLRPIAGARGGALERTPLGQIRALLPGRRP